MAKEQLFVADADKVQDLIFRAARQRQVVGGSRMLAKFGEQVEKILTGKFKGARAIISRGGNFTIAFPEGADTAAFEEEVKLFYHLLLDAYITTAEVEEPFEAGNDEEFYEANIRAMQALEKKKAARQRLTDEAHAPIIAYCHDSGNGLAENYTTLKYAEEEGEYYLSKTACDTWKMGGERYFKDNEFLNSILDAEPSTQHLIGMRWTQNVDFLGDLDSSRNNVAYLLADVNDAGKLFRDCGSEEELKEFSKTLEQTLRAALAKQIPDLFENLKVSKGYRKIKKQHEWLPLLPLIFAGDDVFVMLPAFYALDFARRFCLDFVTDMQKALENSQDFPSISGRIKKGEIASPSISAALIICKANYPYHLAHQRGEKLLKQTKSFSKRHCDHNDAVAALSFDYVIGNQLVRAHEETERDVVPTMNPYWVLPSRNETHAKGSLSLEELIKYRYELRDMPNGHRAKARKLCSDFLDKVFKTDNPTEKKDAYQEWTQRVEAWLARLQKLYERADRTDPQWLQALREAFEKLGKKREQDETNTPAHWLRLTRHGEKAQYRYALPDLLEIWDYAQNLDKSLSEYQEVEQ